MGLELETIQRLCEIISIQNEIIQAQSEALAMLGAETMVDKKLDVDRRIEALVDAGFI